MSGTKGWETPKPYHLEDEDGWVLAQSTGTALHAFNFASDYAEGKRLWYRTFKDCYVFMSVRSLVGHPVKVVLCESPCYCADRSKWAR